MSLVISEYNNDIYTLKINRPDEYNALNTEVLIELEKKLDKINSNCRIIILTGVGNKAFIAGADIKAMNKMNSTYAKEFSKLGQDLTKRIENSNIPFIAAVNGYALGGGCEFALACHIRIASDNAIFGQPEVGLGLIAGFGGTQRLARLIGKGLSLEILLSANSISTTEALSIGLVNKVVSLQDLDVEVHRLSQAICNNSPLAISYTLESVNKGVEMNLNDGLSLERELFSKIFDSHDRNEGLSAFINKRSPKFKGK